MRCHILVLTVDEVNIVFECASHYDLTGETRGRKKNRLRRSSSKLSVPGGDDQVSTSELTHTHTRADTNNHTYIPFIHHKLPITLIIQVKTCRDLAEFHRQTCIIDSISRTLSLFSLVSLLCVF